MASFTPWLNEHGALVDHTATARSPAKDFYQVFLTPSEVVYRLWKIVPPTRPNNHPAPTEVRDTWDDFRHDERLHSEIQRVAGEPMVKYLENIVNGQLDYLTRLPRPALINLLLMLDLEALAKLSQTCHLFRELCCSDEIWEKIYKHHNKQPITEDLLKLAQERGWQSIFFTNKLQLQMQIRRMASGTGKGGNTAFLTEEPMQ